MFFTNGLYNDLHRRFILVVQNDFQQRLAMIFTIDLYNELLVKMRMILTDRLTVCYAIRW
jgi:hypothetical protein